MRGLTCAAIAVLALGCSSTSVNDSNNGSGGTSGTAGAGGGGAVHGCADGTNGQPYAPDMVGCDGALTQCDAEKLCGSGWLMCTYDQYFVRGGAQVSATQGRWLKSCVRDYGVSTTTCPTTSACEKCETTAGTPSPAEWDCNGTVADAPEGTDIGVVTTTSGVLRTPGCPTAKCTYSTTDVAANQYGAMCCK